MQLETKSLFICFVAYSLFLGLSGGAWGKDDPFPSDVKNVAISIRDVDGMEQFPLRVDRGKGSALIFVTHDCPMGGVPKKLPDGLAYRLPEGADLILSTHFHPSGKEETEISTVGFYFSEEPPEQRFTGLQLPPVFGALAGVDIPAGDPSYTIKDSFVLPVEVKAFGVSSHAHYLGKSMKMTATLPDGVGKEMLSISDWDFSWQEQYRYKDCVFLAAGTRLDAEVVWDNSEDNIHNPNTPPKRVTWGRESDDEMGSVTLEMVAANPEEFPKLSAEIRSHRATAALKAGLRRLSGGLNRSQEPAGNRRGLRQRMLERFDGDGDGVLSPSEREAARKAFGR